MGIDRWEKDRCQPIQEARLLANVRSVLGPQVDSLRMPPIGERDIVDPFSAAALIGVPVKPFPRWLRCVKCGLLSPYDAGLFKLKENRSRQDGTRFVHEGCRDGTIVSGPGMPMPFRLASSWPAVPAIWMTSPGTGSFMAGRVHAAQHCGSLRAAHRFRPRTFRVKCDGCGASKNMARRLDRLVETIYRAAAGGIHTSTDFEDDCSEDPRAILLGATNGWFPVTLSVLAIPQTGSPLAQLIADGWTFFEDVSSASEVLFVVKTLKKTAQLARHRPIHRRADLDGDRSPPQWRSQRRAKRFEGA